MSEERDEWVSVKEKTHKWGEDPDRLEGFYRGYKIRDFKDGSRKLHSIEHPGGKRTTFWDAAMFRDLLTEDMVGRKVRIDFEGKKANQEGHTYNSFNVSIKRSDSKAPAKGQSEEDDIPF